MHIRHVAFLFAFLFVGCGPMGSAPDPSPVLVIERGPQTDINVMGGTTDAELLRFDVTNVSDEDVLIRSLAANFDVTGGTHASDGAFTDVKYVDDSLRVIAGPRDYTSAVGGPLVFDDESRLHAHETRTFVLRADLGTEGRSYLVAAGLGSDLLASAVFADSGEPVPADRISGNRALVRVVNVLPAPAPGETVVLMTFQGVSDNILADGVNHRIATFTLQAVGDDIEFRGLTYTGSDLSAATLLHVTQHDELIGVANGSTGSFVNINTNRVTVAAGTEESFELWLAPSADLVDTEIGAGIIGIDVVSAHGGDVIIARVGDFTPARLRVRSGFPTFTLQTLSSATIANGIDQDLFRVQISASGEPVTIASLSLRVIGLDGVATLSDFNVRVGSTVLPEGSYRVVRRFDGADVHHDILSGIGPQQIVIIFDTPLNVVESGTVVTLLATPMDFAAGSMLGIGFGDTGGTYDTVAGALGTDGSLLYHRLGTESWYDCVIWSDNAGTSWTGSWMIQGLDSAVTLTR